MAVVVGCNVVVVVFVEVSVELGTTGLVVVDELDAEEIVGKVSDDVEGLGLETPGNEQPLALQQQMRETPTKLEPHEESMRGR